jgi:Amino-terminal Zinc-binding domain of ubiquitin ligase E3A
MERSNSEASEISRKSTATRKRSSSVQKALDNPLLPLVELKNNSASKAVFEKRVRRYFHQLTVGCLQKCDHKLCASNQNTPSFSPEIAGVMSVQLATNPRPLFCPRIPLEPPLHANFTLSPFGSPQNSPPASRVHSRQSSSQFLVTADRDSIERQRSVSNLQKNISPELDVVPKPFLNSLFSHPSFSAIFGEPSRSVISSLSPLHPSRSMESRTSPKPTFHKSLSQSDLRGRIFDSDLMTTSTPDLQSIGGALIASQIDTEQPQPDEQKLILKYLNIDLLKISIEAYHSAADGELPDPTFLVNSIHGVFSSQSALSYSFLNKDKNGHLSNLNLDSIVNSYNLIGTLQPSFTFQKTLDRALEILISKLYSHVKQNRNPEQSFLRVLMIVILNPALLDTARNESLVKNICCILGKIRSQTNTILISWFSKVSPQIFLQILSVFKKYVAATAPPPTADEGFIGAIKTMSLLSHANEYKSHSPLIPFSEFYVLELGTKLNFKDEFRKWKKTFESSIVTEFAFFNYPFLFDPVAKTRIMHIDAMVKMSLEYEDAYVNQALVLHAKRFLEGSEVMKNFELEMKDSSNPYVVLEVRRNNLVKDVLDQVSFRH